MWGKKFEMANQSKSDTHANVVLFQGAGQPLSLQAVPLPRPAPAEVLVKVRCATLCGSDLHTFSGRRSGPTPSILGHETVGEVVSVGEGEATYFGTQRAVELGDRVTWSIVWSCGRCFYCQRSLHPKCEQLVKFGHVQWDQQNPLLGGLSEYCLLPRGTALVPIPDSIPDSLACIANCAGATVSAIFRYIKESCGCLLGQVIVLQGFGMLGMMAVGMAKQAGAAAVIVLEPDGHRREQSLRFGADVALDPQIHQQEILQTIHRLSDQRGADIVIELSGNSQALELGPKLLRQGGEYYLAGSVFPGGQVNWSAEQIVKNMLSIKGIHNYNPVDLQAAVEFLDQMSPLQRQTLLDSISPPWSLDNVPEAFAEAASNRWLRVAVVPDIHP